VDIHWQQIDNISWKYILSLNKNIAKKNFFLGGGATFLTHTVVYEIATCSVFIHRNSDLTHRRARPPANVHQRLGHRSDTKNWVRCHITHLRPDFYGGEKIPGFDFSSAVVTESPMHVSAEHRANMRPEI